MEISFVFRSGNKQATINQKSDKYRRIDSLNDCKHCQLWSTLISYLIGIKLKQWKLKQQSDHAFVLNYTIIMHRLVINFSILLSTFCCICKILLLMWISNIIRSCFPTFGWLLRIAWQYFAPSCKSRLCLYIWPIECAPSFISRIERSCQNQIRKRKTRLIWCIK